MVVEEKMVVEYIEVFDEYKYASLRFAYFNSSNNLRGLNNLD